MHHAVKGLIDRLPELSSDDKWLLRTVLDLSEPIARERPARSAHPIEDEPGAPRPLLLAAPYHLTEREIDVLDHLLVGLSNKNIGRALGISPRTVETHRGRLMSKLGARSPLQLATMIRNLTLRPVGRAS